MDPAALLSPVGPLPPRVYWLRRAVVLGLVLLVLVGLTVAVRAVAGRSDPDRVTATGTGPPSPGAAGAATAVRSSAPARPSPSRSAGRPTPAARPPSSPVGAVGCARGLVVSVATDAARYPPGALPRFTLAVRNAAPTPCRTDLGPAALTLTVFSGRDRIWSSDDCNPGGAAGPTLLRPREVHTTVVSWGRQRSLPGCPAGLPAPGAGTYRLLGRAGRLLSTPTLFVLL